MDEFTKKRWDSNKNPNAHDPKVALEAALEMHEQVGFDHVVVVYCRKEDGSELMGTGFKQAGSLDNHFGCAGLLEDAKRLMLEGS